MGMAVLKRSPEIITKADLRKLYRLACSDIDQFFARHPVYRKPYEGKERLVALCQGAALHYIDRKNGVKDFDVWFFYPAKTPVLPYRRRGVVDFGPSKFGRHPQVNRKFEGRTVDVLMRSDLAFNTRSPESAIQSYLSHPRTKTAKLLGQKALIGLYPESVFGKVMWPVNKS